MKAILIIKIHSVTQYGTHVKKIQRKKNIESNKQFQVSKFQSLLANVYIVYCHTNIEKTIISEIWREQNNREKKEKERKIQK